jgi:hypothetical protein
MDVGVKGSDNAKWYDIPGQTGRAGGLGVGSHSESLVSRWFRGAVEAPASCPQASSLDLKLSAYISWAAGSSLCSYLTFIRSTVQSMSIIESIIYTLCSWLCYQLGCQLLFSTLDPPPESRPEYNASLQTITQKDNPNYHLCMYCECAAKTAFIQSFSHPMTT